MEIVGFVPEPNCGRGTIGLIWNCLTTIILSTWTCIHTRVNIEDPDSSGRWLGSILCIFMPELVAVLAIRDYIEARQLYSALRNMKESEWRRWSMTQSFLVTFFGVCLVRGDRKEILFPSRLLDLALSKGITIDDFPTDINIAKRDKANWLSKAIAICQAIWFVANILSRLIGNYTVSLLEDVTIAYVFCGIVMYGCWFSCPQDLQEPFEIKLPANETKQNLNNVLIGLSENVEFSLLVLFIMVFVGIQLAAWNYPFLSIEEAWIWRGASLASGLFGMMWFKFTGRSGHPAVLYLGLVYGLCRLLVLGVALAAFRRGPARMYEKPSWLEYWAHVGV